MQINITQTFDTMAKAVEFVGTLPRTASWSEAGGTSYTITLAESTIHTYEEDSAQVILAQIHGQAVEATGA